MVAEAEGAVRGMARTLRLALGRLCAMEGGGAEGAAGDVALSPAELDNVYRALRREEEVRQMEGVFELLYACPLAREAPRRPPEAPGETVAAVAGWWREARVALDVHRLRVLKERRHYLGECLRALGRHRALEDLETGAGATSA